jgi:tetratricopeptide (TPR) repeat protein
MSTNRLEILKNLVAQNPADTFSRYGLAMEYRKAGDLEAAMREFESLLADNPDYVAAYFHAGQTLEKLRRLEQAGEIYRTGIEVARRTGDRHAASELEGALALLS